MRGEISDLFKITKYLRKYILSIFSHVVSSMFDIFFKLAIPYIMQKLMDVVVKKNFSRFVQLIYFATALILFEVCATYIGKRAVGSFSISFARDMKDRIAKHTQNMPIYKLKQYSSGDIISRVSNDVAILASFYTLSFSTIFQPILAIAAMCFMVSISWKLTLGTLSLIPVSAFLFDRINKPIQTHSKEIMEQTSIMNTILKDTIEGIYVLKSFNLERVFAIKFNRIIESIRVKGLKIDKSNAYLTPVFLALRLIPQLVYPLYGGYLALRSEITIAQLFAFGFYISFVFEPMEGILKFIGKVRESKPAFQRILLLLEEPLEDRSEGERKMDMAFPAIEFKELSFFYEEKKKILNKISFQVPTGTVTAIVGPSGSGKSTILRLICGFYKSYKGEIKIFGKQINKYDLGYLRSQISYMSQENYLYPGTIAENILIGKPSATREEMMKAAKDANAHDFIINLPQGYDTFTGEKGNQLSGGQQQRISLARMLLKNAPILLLDEPTASLDMKSEALIQEALERISKDKTVLIIAHRFSTIKRASQIIVIEDGKIVESGLHDVLMNKNGVYKKLFENQFGENRKEIVLC